MSLHKAPIELINKADELLDKLGVTPKQVLGDYTTRRVRFLHELTEFELHRLIKDCEKHLGHTA